MTKAEKLLIAVEGLTLSEANDILEESNHSKLLIVDSKKKMGLRALVTRRDIEKNKLYPDSCKDSDKRLRVGAAVGPAQKQHGIHSLGTRWGFAGSVDGRSRRLARVRAGVTYPARQSQGVACPARISPTRSLTGE